MEPDVTIIWELVELQEPTWKDKISSAITGREALEPAEDDEDLWRQQRVLYAYIDPEDNEIIYLGKAWSHSTWSRFIAEDKEKVWEECGLSPTDVDVIVGSIEMARGMRLTKEMLAVLEGLLIYRLEPECNKQSIYGGKSKEGLKVCCVGEWPYKTQQFIDDRV